jgi:hypothetical protein
MKIWSIRIVVGLAALILGAGYVVRAETIQTAKTEILLDFEFTKNGEAIGKPVVRIADGATVTLELTDGTRVRVTGKTVVH